MVLVEMEKRLGSNGVSWPLWRSADGGRQPLLIDPEENFPFSYTESGRKALQGKEVASDRPHAEMVSL